MFGYKQIWKKLRGIDCLEVVAILAGDQTRLESPNIHERDRHAAGFALGHVLDFLGNVLLHGARHLDVVTIAGGVVARDRLAIAIRVVATRAVHQERVEEDGITSLHLHVHHRARVILSHA